VARCTNPKHIENIKRALMELVGERGYEAVSISMLAKKAKVSTGYLYRHYSSKQQIVEEVTNEYKSLFRTFIKNCLEEGIEYDEFIKKVVERLFIMAKKDFTRSKFVLRLFTDDLFRPECRFYEQDLHKKEIEDYFSAKQGQSKADDLDINEVMKIILLMAISFILTDVNADNFDIEKSVNKVTRICIRAITK